MNKYIMKQEIIEKIKSVVGKENVLTSKTERYVYALDATNKTEITSIPDIVVFVKEIKQVQNIVKIASENEIPIIARGAGTNLVGACITTDKGGIILNFSKMNKILEINQENLTVRVQSGVVVGDLAKKVEEIGLFYPPDPSNLRVSTIGGSIALSSGGPHTFKYGNTRNYVLNLKVVTADGTLMETGANVSKNSTGYHLTDLFIGSEGTLGIIVEATLKLIPKVESKRLVLSYFERISDAAKTVNSIIENKITPSVLDILDKKTLQTIENFCPAGFNTNAEAALFIEVDGFLNTLDFQQEKISEVCKNSGAISVEICKNDKEAEIFSTSRRASFGACAELKPNVVAEDVVVPREKLTALIEGIKKICDKNDLIVCIMGHVGDGNVHPNIPIDLNNPKGVENYKHAKDEIHRLAVDLGGTLSGEHGIGLEKSKYMDFAVDKVALEYMKKIKQTFDSKNILNPDKVFKL